MTQDEFYLAVARTRQHTDGKGTRAAYRVLVYGKTCREAAMFYAISITTVRRAVKRIQTAHGA